jgi:hypothetical protein
MRRQVSRQFIAENESPEEPRAQTAVELEKLPPAGAGEVHMRLFLDAAFIARKHKDDLPLNPETATKLHELKRADLQRMQLECALSFHCRACWS